MRGSSGGRRSGAARRDGANTGVVALVLHGIGNYSAGHGMSNLLPILKAVVVRGGAGVGAQVQVVFGFSAWMELHDLAWEIGDPAGGSRRL